MSEKAKNRVYSKEHIDKFKYSRLGVKASEETKLKMSKSLKGKLNGNKNPKFDHTIFYWLNNKTGESFLGNSYEFYTKYSFNNSIIRKLANGVLHRSTYSYKGWVCTCPID